MGEPINAATMERTIDLASMSEREEKVIIKMKLDGKLAKQFKSQITTIVGNDQVFNHLVNSDCVNLSYTFFVFYFGGVVKAFEAMTEILAHPEVVRSLDLKEMRQGEILIESLLTKVRRVQELCRSV